MIEAPETVIGLRQEARLASTTSFTRRRNIEFEQGHLMATDPGLSFFLVVGRYLSHRPWHDLKTFSGAKDRHPTEGNM
jgi:hypothetical protein